MVMGPGDQIEKPSLTMGKLATDGSNWSLWRATLRSYFESKNLLKHVEGTVDRPPDPPTFPKGHILTDDEEAKVDKAEDRLEKYLAREGLVKTQILISVSESLALMLEKKMNAKEIWDTLVAEMTKKPKMVVISIQRQLRNMKCLEDDDLREHLDKAQDLYSRLNDMGAKVSEEEFLDILLSSLPPSYESLMNTLMTSLEEVGKPLDPDNIIRILKSQYDRRKTLSISHEDQGFVGTPEKKVHTCTDCKKPGHTIEMCWAKGGGREGQGPRQKKRFKSKKKKGKGKGKANVADEEESSGDDDEGPMAFINHDCAAFIRDGIGDTIILDTGASSHMTPHKYMLENYKSFPTQCTIRAHPLR